jgi:predicted Zn-dependent protease
MSETYYFCLKHHTVEGQAGCKAADRLGPYDSPAEASRALEQEPDSVSLRTLRAWAYFKTAQLSRAESDLRRLVDVCPTDVWARFSLGRTLERQSRLSEALTHLRLAYAMSGDTEHEVAVMRVERLLAERTG